MLSNYYNDYDAEIQIDEKIIEIDDTIMGNHRRFENFKVSPNNKYIRGIVENYVK